MASSSKTCSKCRNAFPATNEYFYKSARQADGLSRKCKSCLKEARQAKRAPKPKIEAPRGEKKMNGVTVTCACGHEYTFNITRTQAIDWLKSKPCPPCKAKLQKQKKGDQQGNTPDDKTPEPDKTPTPTPKPEAKKVDKDWVSSVVKYLPTDAMFHRILPEIILLLNAGLPVWLQGPMGTSKSTLAKQAATALGLKYYPQSCHDQMSESKLFGFKSPTTGEDVRTPLWDAFEFGGVFLLDEIDNGNPNLTAALNSALANEHCVFGGGTVVEKHADFRCVATANTAGLGPERGFIGRAGVDLATRDRFVTIQTPIDDRLEAALTEAYLGGDVTALLPEFIDDATDRLGERSVRRETLTSGEILAKVGKLRTLVETRYRDTVVSPRTSMHSAAMVSAGFTLREAFSAKLPGLKLDEVSSLMRDIGVSN